MPIADATCSRSATRIMRVDACKEMGTHKLASLIGDNLSTDSTKTTIELNLAVLKITHEVTRSKKEVK